MFYLFAGPVAILLVVVLHSLNGGAMPWSSTVTPVLTDSSFHDATDGKIAFVKMFAPWCGHCKKLKPDWDKLALAVNPGPEGELGPLGINHVLIADVDCTSKDGKPLCTRYNVRGFPTLIYGSEADGFQSYKVRAKRMAHRRLVVPQTFLVSLQTSFPVSLFFVRGFSRSRASR